VFSGRWRFWKKIFNSDQEMSIVGIVYGQLSQIYFEDLDWGEQIRSFRQRNLIIVHLNCIIWE
jgi:hypothetical protein